MSPQIALLARYQSIKQVNAGKIVGTAVGHNAFAVEVLDPHGQKVRIDCPANFAARGAPKTGDWLVVYEDGYMSWSPAAAFDGGYVKIEE